MRFAWLEGNERRQKFAREVGSVVLGVLIALGLGAVATEIGWQVEVRNARHAIKIELGELVGQADERVNFAPCVETKLDAIARIIDRAEREGRLPPLGELGNPPWRSWPRGVWDSTVSAQTASHFNRDLLDNYSTAYDFAVLIADRNNREVEAWTRLSVIRGPGRAFSPQEAGMLRQVISEARYLHRMQVMAGMRMKQVADAFGLDYDVATAREYSDRDPRKERICRPVSGRGDPTYGQAPFDNVVERVRANPITGPYSKR